MTTSDSGDGHRSVKKNGHDQLQDHELRRLREALASVEAERREDDKAHAVILTKLAGYETELRVSNVRDEEKSKAEGSLRKQVFALLLLFLGTWTGAIAWAAAEFREVHHEIGQNTAHFREFQAIGIEWGDNLDARDAEIKEDLRQLRRLVNEHQRNKSEHAR